MEEPWGGGGAVEGGREEGEGLHPTAPSSPAPVRPAVEAEHREEAAPARMGPLCALRGPLPEGGEERREEGIGAAAGAGCAPGSSLHSCLTRRMGGASGALAPGRPF